MSKMTILDLWKKTKTDNVPLLGSVASLSASPISGFMTEYLSIYPQIDRYIGTVKRSYYPTWNLDMEDDDEDAVLTQFQLDVLALLYKNQVKYQRLWNVKSLDYNPIENYNRDETHSLSDVLTTVVGARSDSFTKGQEITTNAQGVGKTTSTESVNGFNDTDFNNANKTVVDEDAKTDTITDGSRTDSTSIGGHTDTATTTYGHKIITKGNIGVTTSQQMIESEVDLWSKIGFYDIIISDIIKELCNIVTD